jgi:hypothetical protein
LGAVIARVVGAAVRPNVYEFALGAVIRQGMGPAGCHYLGPPLAITVHCLVPLCCQRGARRRAGGKRQYGGGYFHCILGELALLPIL